ncbi:MAG: bifunctional diaminohydroxyphosphoribosylaminopyrimidine deaminase/5-amino-6-(5-phosphoribosylamino)uracil reductase RibD [Candidatus Omnitrophica bacterium]|nr:bifunctional diaminohydroxyphosphoribosylaminopyrimidine deaminase/5-amino-6-(5-phosphoribosylamino)uracil reductase RibD [Candidatus Omnitrophota bacterium]
MQKSLGLARKSLGHTSPNPAVGALVARGGRVLGQGYHKAAGEAHAEREALAAAGKKAQGGTLYVTLEPCSSWGRTPPCTDAIIEAGIRRVVYAARDPNPQNRGKAAAILKKRGIQVTEGVCEAEAVLLIEAFVKFIKTGRPFVIIKVAQSLDGRLATRTGDSKWISDEEARRYGHILRSRADAVLVGVNTVLKDNPRLNARLNEESGPHPRRIILDSTLRIPLNAAVVSGEFAKTTIVATTKQASFEKARTLIEHGVKVLTIDSDNGKIDLKALLGVLGALEITHILVEGGPEVITSFLEEGLADKVVVILAPILIGGQGAPHLWQGQGVERVDEAVHLQSVRQHMIGRDLVIEGYPVYPSLKPRRAGSPSPGARKAHV